MANERLTPAILEGFVRSVLSKNFDQPVETPTCHREWWELCCGRDRFVAIAAPRGFAKSTAITHCYTLAACLFRDRKFVVLVSDTEGQAVMFLQDIKRELTQNETVSNLFKLKKNPQGEVELAKDSETDLIVEFEDGYQFRIVARGAGQRVRGLKWGSRRPDLIICDDLENDEIVLNKDRRDKFKRWFYGALLPIRSDNGICRVVGTILHMDSLLENLMPEKQLAEIKRLKEMVVEPLKEWTRVRLPWKSVKYRAHSQDWAHLLWPEKKTKEWLTAEREKYIAQGLPETYAQEYLNVPLDETYAIFRKADLLAATDGDLQRNVHYYVTVDLAVSLKDRADYSVFTVAALDDRGILQIRNVIRERMDGVEIADMFLHLQRTYAPIAFGVEEGMLKQSILPFLKERMLQMGVFPNIFPLKPDVDKVTRCRSIQGRLRAGGVRFMKEASWYPDLESEMMRFPRDKHDDQVDTMSYLGLMLDRLLEASTPEEVANAEYEREVADSGLNFTGRSNYTGY